MAKKVEKLKYRAVEQKDRTARPIFPTHKTEDRELRPWDRLALISAARDCVRNFALCKFALDKHLQSVGYYQLNIDTPDNEFNKRFSHLWNQWKKAKNCDASGRHCFEDLMMIVESLRAVDGDVGILKTVDNKIQIIESDRIADPPEKQKEENWVHGVQVDDCGKAIRYSIHKRTEWDGTTFERFIPADQLYLLSYTSRYDQIRGVSLIATAITLLKQLEDVYNLAASKLKLEQSIGLVSVLQGDSALSGEDEQTVAEREQGIDKTARDSFGPGLAHISLREGEEIKLIESNNPSSNMQTFIESLIRLVFSSFSLPYSFYDGSQSSFFSIRGELENYYDSVEQKQRPTIQILNDLLEDWLIPNWILSGALVLPSGWTPQTVMEHCSFTGSGMPLWRLLEVGKDAISVISAGLISPIELCESYGYDVKKNIDDICKMRNIATEEGIDLPFGSITSTNVGL